MKEYIYPSSAEWPEITRRPHLDNGQLNDTVAAVLRAVRERGDEAVRQYELQFDHARLDSLRVSEEEMEEARHLVSKELKSAIELAHHNIQVFHEAQRFQPLEVETAHGVTCWQRAIAIQKVGLYIPGGTAPLFSTVLMLATPARIAGCSDIVLCTPPAPDGHVNPAILVAARVAGVSQVYKIGGVQAIGAMAYGTQTVPKVYKIFGPGNQYVMTAKQQVSLHDVAIDMPAGPSEVCVVADADGNPEFIAADLLSQAEHGTDSQVMLITTSADIMQQVREQIDRQMARLPRRDIVRQSLTYGRMVLVHDLDEALRLCNAYAPEHLILAVNDPDRWAAQVVNAGSVFLGSYACESAGDYASGTNHTLPTHGYAVAYNGVNLDAYVRKVTFQRLTADGIRAIGNAVVTMAENEELEAHAEAMRLRVREVESQGTDALSVQ